MHFVTTSLCLPKVKAYAQQVKSRVLPENLRMNLHEQLGALEMGVDQLIQAVVAPQAENIPEPPEQIAASPNLGIVKRAGDLAAAARTVRAGDAIAAIYIPANFERDLKAERRPQVVAFYNQQLLTAAGVASSGLSDSLAAAAKSRRPEARLQ